MLATLDLQLFSVDSLDEPLISSASLLPDAAGEPESGFSDLLRLRVDAALPTDLSGGGLLPAGGSELPVLEPANPLHLAASALPLPDMGASLLTEDVDTPLLEHTDIALESPVIYPPLGEPPVPATVSSLLPPTAAQPDSLDAEVAIVATKDKVAVTTSEVTRPLAEALRVTDVELTAPVREAGSLVLKANAEPRAEHATSVGPSVRLQNGLPQRTAPITLPADLATQSAQSTEAHMATLLSQVPQPSQVISTIQTTDIAKSLPPVDLPKRSDVLPVQGTHAPGEAITELVRPRGVVPQPVQTLHTQLSAPPPQAMFVAATSTAAASDVTYAAVAQQTTDLIGTPVRDSAWGEQMGERVLLMAANQLKTAEIRLTPAELGPLRVQISMDDGATNVSFHAQHAVTREAIEQALPRLREMLAENGLSLGQADVGEQGVAEGNRDGQTDGRSSSPAVDEALVDEGNRAAATAARSNGLIDTFA